MYFDVDAMTSLIGIVGLALAAILSSIGYLYRGWFESKRNARKVLYLLLEIRYALSASFFNASAAKEEYIKHYYDTLINKGFNLEIEDLEVQIGTIVEGYFFNLAKASKTDIEERILKPFEDALSNLSQISPVLAYRLRGKEKLELIAKLNSSYIASLNCDFAELVSEELIKDALLNFAQDMEKEALHQMSKNLDEEIVLLSKHCGWLESRRCKKVLSSKFGDFDQGALSELDSLIDKLLGNLAVAANKALQPTNNGVPETRGSIPVSPPETERLD